MTRRRLMGMVGAAAAGAVGVTVLAASPAGALDPNDVVLGVSGQSSGTSSTGLTSSDGFATFQSINTSGGAGVHAQSDAGDSIRVVAPLASSEGAHLHLLPGSVAGPPPTTSRALGQFWLDADGALWQCVVAGPPASWVRQSPLSLLAAPFRVYDSRVGQANASGSPQGTLAFGATRTINCTPALPAGFSAASAWLMNLTVSGTVGANGALTVFSAAVAVPSASSINWTSAGTNLANAVTSACDSSQDIKVKCVAKAGCSTNFIIDIIGFYP